MLDSVLAENVMAVHRQKRSGVLSATGLSSTLRIAFQDGDPIAIDLGADKDLLLANLLRDCHRLSPEEHAQALAAHAQGQAVPALVSEQGWVSANELGRSLQAVVEESLINFFGNRVQDAAFQEGAADDFDYERRAVRLRIGADVLLRMTSARIDEHRALLSEFGDFSAIYMFDEDAPATSGLNDDERKVLDLVDGRTSLLDMARGLRESRVGLARIVHGLLAKRIIRRAGSHQASTQVAGHLTPHVPVSASAPTVVETAPHPAADSALRAATPTMGDFQPYHATPDADEPPRSRAVFYTAITVLSGILALVGVAVHSYNERQAELQAVTDRFNQTLLKRDWAAALAVIAEATTKADGDLQALRRVNDLRAEMAVAVTAEEEAIRALAARGAFGEAQDRLESLPTGDSVTALRTELHASETAFKEASDRLAATVQQALNADQPTAAVAALEGHAGMEAEKSVAREVLDRWRVTQLESASSPGAPLLRRQRCLERALSAAPTTRQQDEIRRIQADVTRQQARIQTQITELSQRIEQGDTDGGLAEIERLGLRAQVAGTPLEAALAQLVGRTDQAKAAATDIAVRLTVAIPTLDGGTALRAVVEDADRQADQLNLRGTSPLRTLAELGREVLATVSNGSPDTQAATLNNLAATRELAPDLVAALSRRIESLRTLETQASSMLDTARAQIREGDYASAHMLLKDLVERSELKATIARIAAEQELAELGTRIARRKSLENELKTVLAAGDVARGTLLAREMGLKYLPLSIDSVPSGAAVFHGDEQLGTTPCILEVTAADRVEYQLEFRLPGYQPTTASGAQAEAGWRLLVPLIKAPTSSTTLDLRITAAPSLLDGAIVTASRHALARIRADGSTTVTPFGEASVEDPAYAPVAAFDGGLLLPTRNLVAIFTDAEGHVARLGLPVATDLPVASHRSAVIVDRHLLVVAGLDGVLAAGDPRDPRTGWRSERGARFVCGPRLLGDHVLTAREDGRLDRISIDDGRGLGTTSLGAPLIAAWPTATGLGGATATASFTWDGTELVRSPLPTPVAHAAEGVLVTTGGRVLVLHDSTWTDIGRIEGRLTAPPLHWKGHAVLIQGTQARILGPRGFGLTAAADLLPAVAEGDLLVLASQDGVVRSYRP